MHDESRRCTPSPRREHDRSLQKVRGAIGATDPDLADRIMTRIVELAKAGVYDVEELSSQTLSSFKKAG
jgi:hypothetical protein